MSDYYRPVVLALKRALVHLGTCDQRKCTQCLNHFYIRKGVVDAAADGVFDVAQRIDLIDNLMKTGSSKRGARVVAARMWKLVETGLVEQRMSSVLQAFEEFRRALRKAL